MFWNNNKRNFTDARIREYLAGDGDALMIIDMSDADLSRANELRSVNDPSFGLSKEYWLSRQSHAELVLEQAKSKLNKINKALAAKGEE